VFLTIAAQSDVKIKPSEWIPCVMICRGGQEEVNYLLSYNKNNITNILTSDLSSNGSDTNGSLTRESVYKVVYVLLDNNLIIALDLLFDGGCFVNPFISHVTLIQKQYFLVLIWLTHPFIEVHTEVCATIYGKVCATIYGKK
jgi:hypothetical protein